MGIRVSSLDNKVLDLASWSLASATSSSSSRLLSDLLDSVLLTLGYMYPGLGEAEDQQTELRMEKTALALECNMFHS